MTIKGGLSNIEGYDFVLNYYTYRATDTEGGPVKTAYVRIKDEELHTPDGSAMSPFAMDLMNEVNIGLSTANAAWRKRHG
jgi:hypothetical protein